MICRLTELFDQTLYYDITDSSKVAQEDSGNVGHTELFDQPLYYITDSSKVAQEDSSDVGHTELFDQPLYYITDSSKVVQEDSVDVHAIQNCLISPCIMILQTAVKWPRRTLLMCRPYRTV